MRKTFGARLLLAVGGSALLAAGFVACGSSDSTSGGETPDASEASLPDTSVPDTSTDSGVKDTGADTGPVYDAGAPIILDGGDLYEGGVPCVVGGQLELEPNDTEATATPLDPDAASPRSMCGVIFVDPDAGADAGDAGDGGLAETDFLSFQLKQGTQTFYVQYAGDINVDVEIDGSAPITISGTTVPTLPFVRDQPYFVKVTSKDGKRQVWRVSVFEN
jgi:hypothetical protein